MTIPDDPWLSLALVALALLLLFLRVRFPNASKSAETTVLTVAIVLFFAVCSLLLPGRT